MSCDSMAHWGTLACNSLIINLIPVAFYVVWLLTFTFPMPSDFMYTYIVSKSVSMYF